MNNRLGHTALSDSTIVAASKPVYDTPFWPFDEAWSCSDWVTWHKKMKEAYGREKANEIFVTAWDDQSAFASPYNWCKYDREFVRYFESQGLKGGHFLSNVLVNTGEALEATSEGVRSLGKGIRKAGTTTKYLLPVILIGGIFVLWPLRKEARDWVLKKIGRKKK